MKHRCTIAPAMTLLLAAATIARAAEPPKPPATLPSPTLVTLHERDASLETLLLQLTRQSPVIIRSHNLTAPPITIDADKRPLWEVIRRICADAKAAPADINASGIITLVGETDEQWGHRPAVIAGPALFVADQITHSRSATAAGQNPSHTFSISINAWIDPAATVLQYSPELRLLNALDDNGNSLISSNPSSTTTADADDADAFGQLQFTAPLAWPKKPGKRIKSFKAAATLWLATKTERWELDDLTKVKNLTKVIAGRRYIIHRVAANEDTHRIEVTIHRDGMDQHQWDLLQKLRLAPTLNLYDTQNRPLYHTESPVANITDQKLHRTFHLVSSTPTGLIDTGPAVKLVWEIPLEFKPVSVEFELNDLPMP
jgi:hypothetical protein